MKYFKNFGLCALAGLTALFIGACGSTTTATAPATTAAPAATAAETKAPETTPAETKAAETTAAETTAAESKADDTAAPKEGDALTLTAFNGMKLTIPAEYAGLVVYGTPAESEDGVLFTVSEKASVEAAEKQFPDFEGAGWLFDIYRLDEKKMHELMCYDFIGSDPFAKGADGYHYIVGHPTDVRLVRENYENMEDDMEEWSALCEWANGIGESFLSENDGLTKETIGNAAPQVYLARTMWMDDTKYQVSYLEFGPLDPKDVDPEPFARKLVDGAVYEMVDISKAPDGEYYVLDFPEDTVRIDFFLGEPEENYVRLVWSEGYEDLYKVTFEDKSIIASEVMSEWYHALAAANGKTAN
ncbi:MAG: hypothetical protein IJT43_09015 [Stomatobaculum sp.]|nr:hypothetical protein [Stomatobaculum sp.]